METRGRKAVEMVGRTFGRLTVIEYAGKNSRDKLLYKCRCTCGNIKRIEGTALRAGTIKSCGCLLRKNRKAYFIGLVEEAKKVATRNERMGDGC